MKKLVTLFLSAAMVLSLAACGSKPATTTTVAPTTTTAAPTTTKATEGTTAAPTTAAPTEGFTVPELNWPSQPITLWCGYSAGGSSDLFARAMADALTKKLGVSVIVENKPGSNSWQCWTSLIETLPKDGYNFTLVNSGIVTGMYDPTNPRPYDASAFDLLSCQVVDYEGIAIRINDQRFNDFESMVEYGKKNEMFITCSSGFFAGDACLADFLNQNYGTKITSVPVDGSGDQRTMFLAGDTDILIGNVSDLMATGYGTDWKIIMTFSKERTNFTPDVPTAQEQGVNYIGFSARGFAYAKGVDERIVKAMQNAMLDVFNNDKAYMDYMVAQGNNMELHLGQEWLNILYEKANMDFEVKGLDIRLQ